eukprot:COSAG04_NODE_761_length_10520_cov_3.835428_10_plen_113_part_00
MSQANLLEEQIQSAIGSLIPEDNTTAGFLQAQIYPTLVPAVEALLKQFEACEAEGKAPPEPLDWLARCVPCPALNLLVKNVSIRFPRSSMGCFLSAMMQNVLSVRVRVFAAT